MQRTIFLKSLMPILCGLPILFGPLACKPPGDAAGGHSHGHGHGHGSDESHADDHAEDEEVAFPITAWADGYELFVEHGPIVVGELAEFITHVSVVESGQPRRHGGIKFVIGNAAGDTFEHPQGSPARDGIYLPRITFPKAGEWTVTVRIPGDPGPAEVSLGKITVYADDDAAAAAEAPAESDGIAFLKEQQWRYPTLVRPVAKRDLIRRLVVPGEVHVPAGRRGAVTTPIAGRFLAPIDGGRPELGQSLKSGYVIGRVQPVFSDITTRLVSARSAIERAKIQLDDVQRTHRRIAKLVKEGAKSQRELQAVEKELRLAESGLSAARSLESAYAAANAGFLSGDTMGLPSVTLSAPIAGTVVELAPIATGEFVPEGTTVVRTLDSQSVQIHAYVPESMAGRLNSVSGADAGLPGQSGAWLPVFNAESGRLVAVGAEVNHENRTIPVHLETPNTTGRFRVGQQLTVHLHVGQAENALAVPTSALIEEAGLTTVYVQVAGETFQKRVVKIGLRDGDWAQVLSGVQAGEMVAVENAYAIRLASVAGAALPHSHH
jgi:membrane fusion protein, heavy metal efflux system